MIQTPTNPNTQWADAATYLKVLGHPNRLELVGVLREPTPISEIDLGPATPTERSRVLTRQGIRHHLNKLQDHGLVKVVDRSRGGSFHYQADPGGLYRVSEMLSDIASTGRPSVIGGEKSSPMGPAKPEPKENASGAHLVLVHGVDRARCIPLRSSNIEAGRGWVIGSGPGSDVQLEHDPFLKDKHCEIVPEGDGYRLIDLRVSRAGTWLNWDKLELGGDRPLETGDIIGIGRSLLVFRQ